LIQQAAMAAAMGWRPNRVAICVCISLWSVANLVLASFIFAIWRGLRAQVLDSSCNLDPYSVASIRPDHAYGQTTFHWTWTMVYGYFFLSIFICTTWMVVAVVSGAMKLSGTSLAPAEGASSGKTMERLEMMWWTAVLFAMTLLLSVICWTVTYNRSTNAFLFCDFKNACCAENCDPQSDEFLAVCNPTFSGPVCPLSAGASPVAYGCTAYSPSMVPLTPGFNYTGAGRIFSFNNYQRLGMIQWWTMGLLVFAWILLVLLMTFSDTISLAFASRAFNMNSTAAAATKKQAAAGIAPMLSSPNHPIYQLLSHIPSVLPAINGGQHAGVALASFFRSRSAV
jgi:hypothetical protein